MKNKLLAGVSTLILLSVLLFLSAALPGCSEEAPPALPLEDEETDFLVPPGLSMDMDQVIEEFGYPDHFFISIDPLSGDRFEDWTYYSEGKKLSFENGQLTGEEDAEDQSEEYPPTDLKPEDFDSLMTPEEAEKLLGKPVETYQVEDSLMPENTLIAFEEASLLYQDGQLIGVDTQGGLPQVPSFQ